MRSQVTANSYAECPTHQITHSGLWYPVGKAEHEVAEEQGCHFIEYLYFVKEHTLERKYKAQVNKH